MVQRRRVDIVCAESSGGTEPTGMSGGIVSLAEGCATETCVVSGSCTDISSSVVIDRLCGIKSGPRRKVASDCGQKDLSVLGYRVLRGSQTVISSSKASSGASVCVVRSRNVLFGKRVTRSWKLMASVSAILHNLSRTRKENAGAVQHTEQEKCPL